MVIQSRITSKGQITLPVAVRRALALEPGDHIRFFISDGEVRIRATESIKSLYGAVKYDGPPVTPEEMDDAIAEGAAEGNV